MVAKVNSGKSINVALNYNENKVKKNKAQLIMAVGFPKDPNALNFYEKLHRFTNLTDLNKRTHTNTVHVSLNFAPGEILTQETLQLIAGKYMDGIGFGMQPFLVYQHFDAAHPHLHIVTTNISKDGKRIPLHNIGRTVSEPVRKEIERDFGLVKAEEMKKVPFKVKAADPQKAKYGATETHTAINEIVSFAVSQYRFSSVHEFNAILKQYNVIADRGEENSFLQKAGGLHYRLLTEDGRKIGTPIKASSVRGKPTLKKLGSLFAENTIAKNEHKAATRERVAKVLCSGPMTRTEFEKRLKQENIIPVLRQNDQGRIYGITYIDEFNRSVFNGSDLGKEYSGNAITKILIRDSTIKSTVKKQHGSTPKSTVTPSQASGKNILETLLKEEQQSAVPRELKKSKKKKKRGPHL